LKTVVGLKVLPPEKPPELEHGIQIQFAEETIHLYAADADKRKKWFGHLLKFMNEAIQSADTLNRNANLREKVKEYRQEEERKASGGEVEEQRRPVTKRDSFDRGFGAPTRINSVEMTHQAKETTKQIHDLIHHKSSDEKSNKPNNTKKDYRQTAEPYNKREIIRPVPMQRSPDPPESHLKISVSDHSIWYFYVLSNPNWETKPQTYSALRLQEQREKWDLEPVQDVNTNFLNQVTLEREDYVVSTYFAQQLPKAQATFDTLLMMFSS